MLRDGRPCVEAHPYQGQAALDGVALALVEELGRRCLARGRGARGHELVVAVAALLGH